MYGLFNNIRLITILCLVNSIGETLGVWEAICLDEEDSDFVSAMVKNWN